jgi:hypothetical protein
MELNFEELNDTILVTDTSITDTSVTDTNNNSTNYWENKNTNTNTTQKKPRVSYDDILSSLNMVVQNGVLKFANPKTNTNVKTNTKTNIKTNINSNNFITNKYFKDYKEETEPLERRPLTKEEQRELYIKRQQELKHISEVKSKKLLFNTQNINIAPRQNANLNKLFPMFKR